MAETEYSTTARLPVESIWDFVCEMDNWAAYLTGYQSHEKQSETESVWVLKGDVGVLARTLEFKVSITEWAGPERVRFELAGVNEPMTGSGVFEMEAFESSDAAEKSASDVASEPEGGGVVSRALASVLRFFHRLVYGRAERAAGADAGPGVGMARLTFRLRVDPGGPMAPMINAMMKPAMVVAAEDLANRIIGRVEELHAGRA